MTDITRLVEPDAASDVFALAEWILSIPRLKPDAVAIFGCLELRTRTYAIARWRESGASTLLVAGINPNEKLSFEELTLERLQLPPYALTPEEALRTVTQGKTDNTKTQAQWLIRQAREGRVRICEVHASPYHIVRAVATVIAAMDPRQRFIVVPHPTPLSPDYAVAETNASAIEMTAGEYQRMLKYQQGGDVATLEQCRAYLAWLWEQPELAELA